MALSAGSRIGVFEIAEQVGAGGMGEVFRAVDTTLNRTVAIKVLPSSLAHDADRLARFEREAHTLASLNHPNIAQVYGFEKGSDPALVMEFVDGPTLADRIAAGPIPADEAIAIALQITEALEAAHDLGIVHRDLKPANIKVRADGAVKILDFGLAKAVVPEASSASMANSPTITTPAMTQAGVVLGTAAYMSPEQAKGRVVDRRTDIWAFGCVLFEMLTGARAFGGDDVGDVLVAIMRDEPAWRLIPASTPRHVTTLLRRCLQKDLKKRLPHIGVARLELSCDASERKDAPSQPASTGWRYLANAASMLAGAALAAIAFVMIGRPASTADTTREVRFEISPPTGGMFSGTVPRIAVSPDGRSVVFQASVQGQARLWLRTIGATEARQVIANASISATATDQSTQQPFWSPDGREIGFFDEIERLLKAVDVNSGIVRTICEVPGNQMAGAWGEDGTIVFSTMATKGIMRVASTGGTPRSITTLDPSSGESAHLWPDLLPDGRHVVYLASGGSNPGVFVQAIDGGTRTRVLESAFMARVAPPNRLLFASGEALLSQEFDADRLQLRGEPTQIAASVLRTAAGRLAVSASRLGDIVYTEGTPGEDGEGVWVDRRGAVDSTVPPLPMSASSVRLSSDGRTLAYTRSANRGEQVWVYDTERRVSSPLIPGLAANTLAPIFSPDGSHVFFRRLDGLEAVIERRAVSGATQPMEILRAGIADMITPVGVTLDPPRLLYMSSPAGSRGLRVLTLDGSAKPARYLDDSEARIGLAALSPDSRFVALTVGQARQSQVFLQTFPDPTQGRWPVSGVGGSYPRWRPDGKELFFVSEGAVQAVSISGVGRPIGEATRLFELPPFVIQLGLTPYDVAPDGQRFFVVRRRDVKQQALMVILNWQAPR